MLYNKELKTAFVRDYTSSVETAAAYERLFNTTCSYERKFSADICEMTCDQLSIVLNEICGHSKTNIFNKTSMIRSYISWCSSTGVRNVSGAIYEIHITGINKVRENLVPNPAALQERLDALFDPEIEGTMDNVYRAILWMAYAGVRLRDVMSVRVSDVDIQNKEVTVKDRQYRLQEEAMPCIIQCVTLDRFAARHRLRPDGFDQRVDSDILTRGTKSILTIKYAENMLARRVRERKKINPSVFGLSYNCVYESGLFFRLRIREANGSAINFSRLVDEKIEDKYGDKDAVDAETKTKYVKNMKDDYTKWKIAFNL